jgi:hypothetical protein
MAEMTFEQVLRVALQLSPAEQAALIHRLQLQTLPAFEERTRQLRVQVEAEFARRKAAGAYDNNPSLAGRYPPPTGEHPDADEVEAYLHSLNTNWEDDLDGIAK